MRPYQYSRAKAAIFDRKGAGFTSYGHGFGIVATHEVSSSEELLEAVIQFDPELIQCAERQAKVLVK